VIVTHDARTAAYADRVAMVRDGLVSSVDLTAAAASSAPVAKGAD
jgi:ABC-type lipoprotein export system ATPase subunit